MEEIRIIPVSSDNNDLHRLISKLDTYLEQLFPPEEIFLVDFDDPKINESIFVVAYMNDIPIGCGGLRPLNNLEIELKRFYVEPAYRRLGIAKQILNFLELSAQGMNYKTIRLETGDKQTAAIRFYEISGYKEIERFGEYVDCLSSRCYEKRMT